MKQLSAAAFMLPLSAADKTGGGALLYGPAALLMKLFCRFCV